MFKCRIIGDIDVLDYLIGQCVIDARAYQGDDIRALFCRKARERSSYSTPCTADKHCPLHYSGNTDQAQRNDESSASQLSGYAPNNVAVFPPVLTLLVIGATAVLRFARNSTTTSFQWAKVLLERKSAKIAAVALANKVARLVLALMTKKANFRTAMNWQSALRVFEVNRVGEIATSLDD